MEQITEACSLSQLQQLEDYRQTRAHLLPSKFAMQWYIRRNKTELVKGGAILLSGRSWYVDPARFDAVFRAIAQRNALAHLSTEQATADAVA